MTYSGAGLLTTSGRVSGTQQYAEFECPAAKKVAPTEDHFIHKLEDVRTELKAANAEVAELSSKLKDKQSQITSYAKRVSDLERRVRQLGN